jgi:small subunit ribosomal protein S17
MSKILTGVVISNKMEKTVVVDVQKKFSHPRYRKVIIRHKKYKVHCEDGSVNVGDVVTIKETKPISKDKHFVIVKDAHVKAAPVASKEIKLEATAAEISAEVKEELKTEKKAESTPEKKTTAKKAAKKAAK